MNEVTFRVAYEKLHEIPPVLHALDARVAMDWATRMTGVDCTKLSWWDEEWSMHRCYRFEFAGPVGEAFGKLGLG